MKLNTNLNTTIVKVQHDELLILPLLKVFKYNYCQGSTINIYVKGGEQINLNTTIVKVQRELFGYMKEFYVYLNTTIVKVQHI